MIYFEYVQVCLSMYYHVWFVCDYPKQKRCALNNDADVSKFRLWISIWEHFVKNGCCLCKAVPGRNIAHKVSVNYTYGKCISVFDVLNVLDVFDLSDLFELFNLLCTLKTYLLWNESIRQKKTKGGESRF